MALSEREILAAIDAQAERAYGTDGTLDSERAQAIDYYLGRPYGNEVDGRSQVVTRDVLETVEWIKPSLMRIFFAGDKVLEFEPVGLEDEPAAKQETDTLNHVILKQNDAFMTFLTWFTDGLLAKTSYVKIYWDEHEDVVEETYQNLSEPEVGMISQDQGVEIVEVWPGEMGFGVKVKRTQKQGKVCIDPVPGEEMRVSASVRGYALRNAPYIEHRTMKTLSDIRAMGFDVADDISGGDEEVDSELSVARDIYDEDMSGDDEADPSMREVLFRDVTIRIDANGDGIAELKRYYIVGNTILADYDAENVYYACLGPIPMPHRHVGLSVADLVMDLQKIRSTLLRSYIDNLYLQNNGRFAISDRVNLDDMLVSRPGGVVRVEGDPNGAIMPLVHPSNGAAAIQGLEYIDTQKENRTGVTKYNQGLDSNSLNKTMGGITQIMNAAQQRIELIARVFSETGVKDAFLLVHELLKKHSDKPLAMRLNNQYVDVDPRQWKTRTDMTVSVGLGTGNKDQQQQHIATIMQVQEKAMMAGLPITDAKKIYAAAKRLAENAGFKDGDEFFTDPSTVPPQPPKPNPDMVKAQGEMQIKQQEAQLDAQIGQQKMQQDGQMAQQKLQADLVMAQQKLQNDMQLAREKMQADIQLAREKAYMEAQLKSEIAAMQPKEPETEDA